MPEQILTDNGKVFTGRFNHPPAEVLFDRICRENGIEHLLTQPRSSDDDRQDRAVPPQSARRIPQQHRLFSTLTSAQQALDEWVSYYNTQRPHQADRMAYPGRTVQRRGLH